MTQKKRWFGTAAGLLQEVNTSAEATASMAASKAATLTAHQFSPENCDVETTQHVEIGGPSMSSWPVGVILRWLRLRWHRKCTQVGWSTFQMCGLKPLVLRHACKKSRLYKMLHTISKSYCRVRCKCHWAMHSSASRGPILTTYCFWCILA